MTSTANTIALPRTPRLHARHHPTVPLADRPTVPPSHHPTVRPSNCPTALIPLLTVLLLVTTLSPVNAAVNTDYPVWWTARSAVSASDAAADYAVCNSGQLKYMALQAMREFDATLPGGAGITISNMVNAWISHPENAQDYSAINAGQLKAVAAPFYDRLKACNWPCILPQNMTTNQDYPWSGSSSTPQDYSMANNGQVKYVFSFSVVNVKINGDYNRNGNPADDPHKDDPVTFAGPKGFVILANNNDSDGDGEPDCNKSSGQYLIKANDVPDIYQFYVSKLGIPSNAIPSGMSVVIEVLNPTNGNTSADAVIFATCAVGSSGGTSLTFENDTGVVGKYFGGTGTAILGIEGRKHGQEVCVRVTVKLNGTIIGTDEMRVLVAPWLALANNSPVVKIYSGFGGDASFYSDMNALFGSGNITWTNTASWRQDEGEFGYTRTGVGQSTYVARPVVLDFNSTTTDFFHDGTNDIKSLISASRGWDDSARKDFEHQGGGVEVSIPDASHPYGRLILSDWYTNFAQYAFFQNQKVQGPPILLPVNWLLVGHVDEVMSIVPNGSSYIICVADLTNDGLPNRWTAKRLC